jgi:hypothetical protein
VITGVGVAMVVTGLVLLGSARGGVEASSADQAQRRPRWRFGVAPGPGGVFAAASVTF